MKKILLFLLILTSFSFSQLPSSIKWWHLAQDTKDSLWSIYFVDSTKQIVSDSLGWQIAADTTELKTKTASDGRYVYLKQLSATNPNGGGWFILKSGSYTPDGINIFSIGGDKYFIRLNYLANDNTTIKYSNYKWKVDTTLISTITELKKSIKDSLNQSNIIGTNQIKNNAITSIKINDLTIDSTDFGQGARDFIYTHAASSVTINNNPDGLTLFENTIGKLTINNELFLNGYRKYAIEKLNVQVSDTGTNAYTVWSRTTNSGSWEHFGRLEIWSPPSDTIFNNFAFRKGIGALNITKNDKIYIYESAYLSTNDSEITTDFRVLVVIDLKKEDYNNTPDGGWLRFYTQDITAKAGRYYYFYWKNLNEKRKVIYGGTYTNSSSYFWNTTTSNWSATSQPYNFQVRYNQNLSVNITIPTNQLSGKISNSQLDTIKRSIIDTNAVVDLKHKLALEELDVRLKNSGTPRDSIYSHTTANQPGWLFYGQVIRLSPTEFVQDTINNIGFKRGADDLINDFNGTIYRGKNLISTDVEIRSLEKVADFTFEKDLWNTSSDGNYVYAYFEDVILDTNYYYYFYWKHLDQKIEILAGTRTKTTSDLFWYATTSDWATTSKDWTAIIRYNNNVKLKLNIGSENISNISTNQLNNNLSNFIGQLADSANPLQLLLPDTIFIAGGLEANIYFDNIVMVPDINDYIFDVVCDSGANYSKFWSWVPNVNTAGDFNLTINIYNWSNKIVGSASTVLHVSKGDTLINPKKILFIGNSLTAQNVYPDEVINLGGKNLTAIGTQGTTPHEGWSGKTFQWFWSNSASPFYNLTTGRFDISYYLTTNSFPNPDYIVIHLGSNDVFNTSDISSIIVYADSIIQNIRTNLPNTHIAIAMIIPPAYSQDAFGFNYNNGITRWEYKRRVHLLNQEIKNLYGKNGSKANSYIHVVPYYVFLDTKNNMQTTSVQVNARNSQTEILQSNGLHPATSGYYQMSDAIFGWIKSRGL